MSRNQNQNQNNDKGSNFTKGFIALFGVAALGGGAYTLYSVIKNQNNPVFNIQGSQATAKAGDNNLTLVNSSQNAVPSALSETNQASPTSTPSPTPTVSKIVDISVENKWTLKIPLYRTDKDKCNLVGFNSIPLSSSRGGGLYAGGFVNVYGNNTNIQGSVTSSGTANLSLTGNSGIVVTFESDNVTSAGETIITGTTTAINCPPSKFELRKQG